jgi:hypothetical protein
VWSRLVRRFERIGDDPEDSVEIRLQKRVLVAVSVLVGGLAVIWGAIYLAYDEPRAALIPWVYAAAVSVSLAVYAVTHRSGCRCPGTTTLMPWPEWPWR